MISLLHISSPLVISRYNSLIISSILAERSLYLLTFAHGRNFFARGRKVLSLIRRLRYHGPRVPSLARTLSVHGRDVLSLIRSLCEHGRKIPSLGRTLCALCREHYNHERKMAILFPITANHLYKYLFYCILQIHLQ